jgi:nucleotide sugar dehydrogenase
MTTAIIGLGKIGLPLAVQCAGRGEHVIGVDISDAVVASVNAGQPPFPGEPGLEEGLASALRSGLLRATADTAEAVGAAQVVVIVVPLVVGADGQPDFTAIDAATASVATSLRPESLVIYETTLPIGTTRGRFAGALARPSGLEPGRDLFVCHSPERVSSGTVFRDLRRYPKLVGGIDAASATRAVAFYERVLDFDERADLARPNGVWDLGSAEAAEMAKLAETTYRDVNIAFANELAVAAERHGLDVADVIAASNSQPYSHIHSPGISVGGHCIPVYPHFLLGGAPGARLPAVAREVNRAMPGHLVGRLETALGSLAGVRVAVLGLSYRQGVKEDAFSGAYDVVAALRERGATALVHDPLYSAAELRDRGLEPYGMGEPCEGIILHTAHPEYAGLGRSDVPSVRVVVDGRRLWHAEQWAPVKLLAVGVGP